MALFFRSIRRPSTPSHRVPVRPRFRPAVECLEDRLAPASIYVTGNVTNAIAYTDPGRFNDGPVSALTNLSPGIYLATNLRSAVVDSPALAGSNTIFLDTGGTFSLTQGELQINFGPATALTIQSNIGSQATINANNTSRLFEVFSGGATTLDLLNLVNGNGTGNGLGGGGAIFNHGNLTLTSATISGSSATGSNGGGLYNAGTLNVSACTFAGNSANLGGAIATPNGVVSTSNVVNSTFQGNSAQGGNPQGGAIFNGGSPFGFPGPVATLNISFSTISGNSVNGTSGFSLGGGIRNQGTVNIKDTIVAGNTLTNVNPGNVGGPDVSDNGGIFPFTSGGHNLIGNGSGSNGFGASGDQVGTSGSPINPNLGALASNGGPTQTMLPGSGSPAINTGNNNDAAGLTTDQRGAGFPRINGTVDIGAVEVPLATTVYVDNIWGGTAPGTDPAHDPVGVLAFDFNAFADIQTALNNLASGGTIVIFAENTSYAGFTVNNPVALFDVNQNPLSPTGSGLLVINSPVTLNQNVVFTQAAMMPGPTTLPAADLEFDGNIVTGGTPESLTVNGNANQDRFQALGTVANPLSSVDVASSSRVTLQQDVATSTTQVYNAPVLVEDAGVATLTGTTVTFGGTVASNVDHGNLTIAGNAVFNGIVGGGGNLLTNLQVIGTTALDTTAVTTAGTQTFANVTLGANTVLSSTGTGANGDITFGGSLQSPGHFGLTVNTGGIITFGGAVGGGGNTLGALTTDAGGSTQINGGSVNTSGFAQTYNDDVTLGAAFTLLAGIVNFNADLSLGTDVVQVAGTLNFTNTTTLTTTIAGTAPSQVGHMLIGGGNTTYGNATLVLNYSGFTPMSGDSFDIVSNGGFGIGQFSNAPAPGPDLIDGVYYLVTYSGTAGGGDFILTVAQGPAITSAAATTFTVGTAGSFTVTATGNPAPTFSLTNAPAFLSINSVSGVITGTPPNLGAGPYTFSFTVTASNGVLPNAVQNFTLTVDQAPAITSAAAVSFTIGTAGSFTITTAGFPTATSITVAGPLPHGLTFTNNGDGTATIAGMPSGVAPGPYTLFITAANGISPAAEQTFTLTVVASSTKLLVTGADAGGSPQVNVYNGTTGAFITSFFAFAPSFLGGVRVAVGDVNGDGTPDIICAAGPGTSPEVRVFDGKTFQLIADFFAFTPTFGGGVYVAAGDVNGDGFADVIVGAGAGGGPQVTVYSGKDGSVLANFYAYAPTFGGGVRVAAGDLDGDGRADIVTGAGPGGLSEVRAFSGATGQMVADFFAFGTTFTGGVFVAVGSANGLPDIICGAGAGGGPEISLFSSGGLSLRSFYDPRLAPTPTLGVAFATDVRVAAGTVGGKSELLTAAGGTAAPLVDSYDGSALNFLGSFFANPQSFSGGLFLADG